MTVRHSILEVNVNFSLYIHAFDQEKLLPLVYSLSSSTSRDFYITIFNIVKREAARMGLVINPTTILSDFESGLIPTVRTAFPHSRYRGCHVHFCQAIHRNVQRLCLVGTYDLRVTAMRGNQARCNEILRGTGARRRHTAWHGNRS